MMLSVIRQAALRGLLLAVALCLSVAAEPASLTVSGKFLYFDRANVLRPLKYVKVQLLNGATGAVLTTAYTNSNGQYTFAPVTNPGAQGFRAEASTFWLASTGEGFAVRQKDPGADQFTPFQRSSVYTTSQASFTIPDVTVSDPRPFQLHRELVDAFLWTTRFGDGDQRGPGCEVVWYTAIPEIHPTRFIEASSSPGETRIEVYGRDADEPEYMLISYGMAVMWDACDQWLPSTTPHEWTVTMPLEYETTEADAWKKGFAAWFYMASREQPTFHDWHRAIWYNLEPPTWGDPFYGRGDKVECMVAAALWDLGDSTVDGIDTANFDWFEIWDVWYGQRLTSFSEFWARWKSLGKLKHDAVKALYQSTIDYNTTPQGDPIGSVWVSEDSVVNAAVDLWPLTSDAESSDSELTYSISSVQRPECGAFIYNSRYVGFDPEDNWNGTSTVTVNTFDGVRTLLRTFTVTVQPVNDLPVWTAIQTITLPEDSAPSQVLDLYTRVSDVEDPDSGLTLTVESSTHPEAGVSISQNRYLAIAPAASWWGTTTVTLKATDTAGGSRTTSFQVTISPVNDPPRWFVPIPDKTLLEDTTLNNAVNLWSYASDIEQPVSELTFAITANSQPDAGVTLDSNRYIDINPAPGWQGTCNVTVRVTDGDGASASDSFVVQVLAVNDTPVIANVPDVFCSKNGSRDNVLDLWAYTTHQDSADPVTYSFRTAIPPGPGITLDCNRYIDVSPATGWSGVTTVVIRVTDSLGAYTEDTVEFRVATIVGSPAEARGLGDGEWVQLGTYPVITHFPGAFYMGYPHTSGIRVAAEALPPVGAVVGVFGLMGTWEAERIIQSHLITTLAGYTVEPTPSTMRVSSVGGSAGRGLAPELVPSGAGIYNPGLLVRVAGTVAAWDPAPTRFTVQDGSRAPGQTEQLPLMVEDPESGWRPSPGTWVELTGISGATFAQSGEATRILRLRGHGDAKVLSFPAAFIYGSNLSAAKSFDSMLHPEGVEVTVVPVTSAGTHDFSMYAVIIIAADSGQWTNRTAVSNVLSSGRPVVGIGAGGASFFDQVESPDLFIGLANSTSSSISAGKLASTLITAYPYELPFAIGDTISLSKLAATTYSVFDRGANCVHLMAHPTSAFSFSVAREGRFWQWGYSLAPAEMSVSGWKLFVNTVFKAASM